MIGSPKFTLKVPAPPGRPLAEKFLYPKLVLYQCVFNFNFQSLVVSEILEGPKFTVGALRSRTPPSGKILTYAQVLAYTYIPLGIDRRSTSFGEKIVEML